MQFAGRFGRDRHFFPQGVTGAVPHEVCDGW